MITYFFDVHSGGGSKEQWQHILIEAPQDVAELVFYNRFGHNPNRVTCTCCGPDYSIYEHESLEQATAYHRNCFYDKESRDYLEELDPQKEGYGLSYVTLTDYLGRDDVLFISKYDIESHETLGELPAQGYVWAG